MTERAQNADFRRKPQIFADSPLLLEIQACGGLRKPQKTADLRRKPRIFAGSCRKLQIGLCHLRSVTGKSHPWTNTSVGGNFRKSFRTIGPYEFPRKRYGPMIGPYEFPRNSYDQWGSTSKFSESFSLDRHWSIESQRAQRSKKFEISSEIEKFERA